jgi:hypothetical protein
MESPSEKCAKCNWWLLLEEIREVMIGKLEEMNNHDINFELKVTKNRYGKIRQFLIESIMSIYSQSAHKVCKEHWEGKR